MPQLLNAKINSQLCWKTCNSRLRNRHISSYAGLCRSWQFKTFWKSQCFRNNNPSCQTQPLFYSKVYHGSINFFISTYFRCCYMHIAQQYNFSVADWKPNFLYTIFIEVENSCEAQQNVMFERKRRNAFL